MKKTTVILLWIGILLVAGAQVFADDVEIDSSGNVTTGTPASGNLEVTGASAEKAIVGQSSGTGGSGVYGINTTSGNYGYLGWDTYGVYGYNPTGWAGYFQGNARVTGTLQVDGGISGGGVGDITGVTAGTGLSGGGLSGDVTIDADTTYLQRRVTGTCLGQVMVGINSDGTVTCETDDTGDSGIWSQSGSDIYYNSGNVGIGTTSPNGHLHIQNAAAASVNIGGNGNLDKAQLGLFEDSDTGEETGILLEYDGSTDELNFFGYGVGFKEYDLLTIQRDGKVGIGTTSPRAKLEVEAAGTDWGIRVESDNRHAVFANSKSGGIDYHAVHAWAENSIAVFAHTGESFILPGHPANRSAVYAVNELAGGVGVYGHSNSHVGGYFKTDAANGFGVVSNGKLGVTNVPVWNGTNANDVTWDGYTISREGSSIRYKQNIRSFDEDFRKILKLEARQYQMKEGYGDPDKLLFGYIAEELDEAGLAALVNYDAEGRPDGVKYKKIGIYLAEIVKEQEQEMVQLRSEMAELSETVKNLERLLKLQGSMAMVEHESE